ncbi:hypothetical protein [Chromobacterium paludis]|uniref:DUF4136 domain-containing protein n=1 Tax=Chromobacterium paludis TaxID=2605945 RepID=A0A5C1DGW2_9NEIS|nr:hypothetical protein [Chromobacterium paludis]QEL55995.1 hypothetical protein FYK34_10710 [Chromobacterium paludis]
MRLVLAGGAAAGMLWASLAWAGGQAASAPAAAVAKGVMLECLPSGGAAIGWHDWMATQLALRGLQESGRPAWRLCFAESLDQQWVAQPPGWRDDGYWRDPPYRLESWPALSLTVRGVDGAVFWSGRERLGGEGNARARLEAAARRLLDRLPLPL